MNAIYDDSSDEWLVELTKEELENAFKSYSNYYNFLKLIMANTYENAVAELCFPGEVNDDGKEVAT